MMAIERFRQRTSEKWRKYSDDVLPLFVAEMDFPLAPAIAAALHDAVNRSDTGYAEPRPLRAVFTRYAKAAFDWTVHEERFVVVNDVMGGVLEALGSLTAAGDGVVVMPPVYPPFFEIIRIANRRIVEVPLMHAGRWAIDWDGLEAALRGGAKALLLCHPHNPVGRVFARDELQRIAFLAQQFKTLVISDEIHAPLLYPGNEHVPFVRLSEPLGVDAVTLMSASKGWNIAGLKCAQMIAGSERVYERFRTLPRDVTDRIGHLGVIATIAAYEHGAEWLRSTMVQLGHNRRQLSELLSQHAPSIQYRVPDATYLAWLDCRSLHLADDPAEFFIKRGKVALTSGPDFGEAGRGFARLNFGTTPEILREGVARVRAAIESI